MKEFTLSARNKLKQAYNHCGSQTKLAEKISELTGIKVYQSMITKWYRHTKVIPGYACRPIEQITKGLVKAYELRPDLWDAPNKESEQSNAK